MRIQSVRELSKILPPWRLLLASAVILLAGCAGRGEIAPENTAGAIVLMGVSTEGKPVNNLGYNYVLNFARANIDADADEVTTRITISPRSRDGHIIIDELPPGDWTLVSFAARLAPGVDGFSDISLRSRPVHLDFPVVDNSVQILSHELVINHRDGRAGLTATEPRMAPLSDRTRSRLDRRVERLGSQWTQVTEPVGTMAERDETPRRSLLERILGD